MKTKKWMAILLGAVMGLTVLTSCGTQTVEEEQPVETEVVKEETEKVVNVFGAVIATKEREINIDLPATITEVKVKKGDLVQKGETLFTLDLSEYKQQIAQKENEIKVLQAELQSVSADLEPVSIEINNLRNQIHEKEARLNDSSDPELKMLKTQIQNAADDLKTAQKDYAMNKELFESQALTQKELEDSSRLITAKEKAQQDAQESFNKAKLVKEQEIKDLKAQLDMKKAQLGNSETTKDNQIEKIRLQIEGEQLSLENMKSKLNKPYLVDGQVILDQGASIITAIDVKEGGRLGTAPTACVTLVDQASLKVEVKVPESFVGKIAISDEAELSLYADPENTLTGKVVYISNEAEEINGQTMVKAQIEINGSHDKLKPGYQVDASIKVK